MIQYVILGGGLVLLANWGCQQAPSPKELAQKALEAATSQEQELAAVELAEVANDDQHSLRLREEARRQMRRVLAESQSPPVRSACIQGLASLWDYDSLPVFLDALDDESDLIRSRAGASVERMMSASLADFGYRYNDPPGPRAAAIKRIREDWEKRRDSPVFIKWRKRLEQKKS